MLCALELLLLLQALCMHFCNPKSNNWYQSRHRLPRATSPAPADSRSPIEVSLLVPLQGIILCRLAHRAFDISEIHSGIVSGSVLATEGLHSHFRHFVQVFRQSNFLQTGICTPLWLVLHRTCGFCSVFASLQVAFTSVSVSGHG